MWAHPKVDPCRHCDDGTLTAKKRTLDSRVARSGFPIIPYVLHPKAMQLQREGTGDDSFVAVVKDRNARTAGDEPPVIGATLANRGAIERMLAWVRKPNSSVLLYGPSGTGKTLLACAAARALLAKGLTTRRVYVDEHGRPDGNAGVNFDRTRPTAIMQAKTRKLSYKRVDTVVDEQKDRFRERNTQPVRYLGRYRGILFFDEVGITQHKGKIEEEVVNHVLGTRLDYQRHTVVITNLSPHDFARRYGQRVGSRLRSFLHVELQHPDWR